MLARVDRVVGGCADLAPPILAGLGPFDDAARLADEPGPPNALAGRLDAISAAAAELSDRLSMRFFAHAHDGARNRVTLAA
jgi:hypothetical protein